MAQHEHAGRAQSIVLHAERPPVQRLSAKHVEECGGNGAHRNTERLAAADPDRAPPVHGAHDRDVLERPASHLELLTVAERDLADGLIALQVARPKHHDTLGCLDAERSEQHGADDAEHCGVGANADREHQHGGQREAGLFQQRADRVGDG